MSGFSVSDLTNILTTINSGVAGGLSTLAQNPVALATAINGMTTALGPSTAEQTLGKDLDLYAKFQVQAFGGNAGATVYATNIQIAVMGITGLPGDVQALLAPVWVARDESSLITAITNVKLKAGLGN